MSTNIRPEVSSKNKYHISKHRYYELRHFAAQYHDYKLKKYELENSLYPKQTICDICVRNEDSITERKSLEVLRYENKIRMIEDAARESDSELCNYILLAAVDSVPVSKLQTVMNMPCCRDTFYDRYRKFFYILDKLRD